MRAPERRRRAQETLLIDKPLRLVGQAVQDIWGRPRRGVVLQTGRPLAVMCNARCAAAQLCCPICQHRCPLPRTQLCCALPVAMSRNHLVEATGFPFTAHAAALIAPDKLGVL